MSDARAAGGGTASQSALEAEHRSGRRQKQLKSGIIVMNDRRSTLACTIRDISESGARLKLGSVVNLPQDFELILVNERKIVPVQKCWHSHPECGVSFTGPMRPAPTLALPKV
jgi:PilZ domain